MTASRKKNSRFAMPALLRKGLTAFALLASTAFSSQARTNGAEGEPVRNNVQTLDMNNNRLNNERIIVTKADLPERVPGSYIKPYDIAKIQYIIDATLAESIYDGDFEYAARRTGIAAIRTKVGVLCENTELDPNVVNPASGATGLSQIIEGTALTYDMDIGNSSRRRRRSDPNDDRRDPGKSILGMATIYAHNARDKRVNGQVISDKNHYLSVLSKYHGKKRSNKAMTAACMQYELNHEAIYKILRKHGYQGLEETIDVNNLAQFKTVVAKTGKRNKHGKAIYSYRVKMVEAAPEEAYYATLPSMGAKSYQNQIEDLDQVVRESYAKLTTETQQQAQPDVKVVAAARPVQQQQKRMEQPPQPRVQNNVQPQQQSQSVEIPAGDESDMPWESTKAAPKQNNTQQQAAKNPYQQQRQTPTATGPRSDRRVSSVQEFSNNGESVSQPASYWNTSSTAGKNLRVNYQLV